jgi:hypothetical protein
MKQLLKIFILLAATFVFSQEKEVVPPYNIKTVTFSQNVNNTIPFFRLGENFDLQFDDLYGNEADYFYSIEQYNYDWTPSQLLKNEYLNGLDNQRIQNYQNSLNCLQIYSHYTLSFPNKFNQIISLAEYNSLCATQHEMSSKKNEKRLDSAIEKLKSGNSSTQNLIEE